MKILHEIMTSDAQPLEKHHIEAIRGIMFALEKHNVSIVSCDNNVLELSFGTVLDTLKLNTLSKDSAQIINTKTNQIEQQFRRL